MVQSTTAGASAALRAVRGAFTRSASSSGASASNKAATTATTAATGGATASAPTSAASAASSGGFHLEHFAEVPPVPLALGLAGAIPFVALAAPVAPHLPVELPDAIASCRAQLQAGYGATILSFLGKRLPETERGRTRWPRTLSARSLHRHTAVRSSLTEEPTQEMCDVCPQSTTRGSSVNQPLGVFNRGD